MLESPSMGNPLVIIGVGLLVFLAHLFASLFEKTRVPGVLPPVFAAERGRLDRLAAAAFPGYAPAPPAGVASPAT